MASIIFSFIYVSIIKPKLDRQEQINTSIKENNLQTEKECQAWKAKKIQLENEISILTETRLQLERDMASINSRKTEVLNSIEELKAQIDDNALLYYNNIYNTMQDRLQLSAEAQSEHYQQSIEKYLNDYLDTLKDASAEFNNELKEKKEQLQKVKTILEELTNRVQNLVEANKRAENENKDVYRLILSELDLNEIIRLREIIPYLREARPLNKMIWEGYYQKPYKDLINRVLGDKKTVTGIYKLTDLTNNKAYIGQAVDIAGRWSEHIKKGLGIDTNNQIIYTAMKKVGPENFTFEILEECTQKELNEKEKYWITLYKTTEFGYNMKVG